ncbi:MAG: dihydrofolate reductase family protein [Candidatus Aenigmatarchaeota archaeon]
MRPEVMINVAMSADGKIALPDRTEVKISGEEDFERVHELRNEVDAILVGIGTVLSDDPKLTVKEEYVSGERVEHPLKVVLDSKARTPEDAQLFEKGDWLIATTEDVDKEGWIRCGRGDRVDIGFLLDELEKRGIETLLVEGGGEVISSFFELGAVDKFTVFVGSLVIGGREAPTPVDGEGAADLDGVMDLEFIGHEELDEGILLKYKVRSDE